MNDSADIKAAAQSLQSALSKLEGAIDPLLSKVRQLSVQSVESESFFEDRARLASELDNAKADKESLESHMRQREQELDSLAKETSQEIELVMRHVQSALEGMSS